MNQLVKLLGVVGLAAVAVTSMSCDVHEYCLNCATGDGGHGDAGDVDASDAGVDPDAPDAGPCVPTGSEICDGKDNDCNGQIDEGTLPGAGADCANQTGECAGGKQQCVNGALVCDRPPMPEACDNKDNDCDGVVDDGDPAGGAVCGTNTGECVAGAYRCVAGTLECIGRVDGTPEICNNRDDDCDGKFDEDLTLGPCVAGDDGPAEGDTGECKLGVRQCVGGAIVCSGAVFPTFEQCDGLDQDCDGSDANGYDTMTDPQNCGACGAVCDLPNAFEGCAGGACTILACAPNFFDNDHLPSTGCEFNCGHPYLGNEVCNGIDDDCDGLVDGADSDMLTPTGICASQGACSTGTNLTCTGVGGWVCDYTNPNVQTDGLGNIVQETRCDGDLVAGVQADNDCDGFIDEGTPGLGDACDNGELGDCRSTGAFACNIADREGPAACVYTDVGPGMGPEICDGRDNNCNNQIDEGAETGDLAGQEWVNIPGSSPQVQIMKYEASRPDATTTSVGFTDTVTCSRPDVQPWVNLTHPQAEQACAAIGARLCSEAEWESMCVPATPFPIDATALDPASTASFAYVEAEDYYATTTIPAGDPTRAWTRYAPASFHGTTGMQVPDNNFAVTTAANASTQSSRLDYQFDLAGSTSYYAWMHVYAPATANASPYGVHTAPIAGTTATSDASTAVGDLVIAITWTADGSPEPDHTLETGWTEILSQSNDDGSRDTRLSVAYRVVTTAGAVAYTAYTSSVSTGNYTGLIVLKAGRYDLGNAILSDADTWDDNTAPNPPDAGSFGGNPYVVLAIGGWHMGSATTVSVSAPTNFAEAWEVAGSNVGELSVALGSSDDPGRFGDGNVGNTSATAATVAIRLIPSLNNGVWVGLAAGGSAGGANGTAVAATAADQWQWVVSPALTSGAAGLHTFSLYTEYDGMVIDSIAIARQDDRSPDFDNSWAYQDDPRTAQPQTCNVDDYDTDPGTPGDQDGVLPTGSLSMCFANKNNGAEDGRAYDMTGNVKEWVQARLPGENPLRGGASNNEVPGSTCKLDFTLANDEFFFPNAGFRCCR